MTCKTTSEYQCFAQQIRMAIIRQMGAFGGGHVGGAMSIADLLAVLYGGTMHVNPQDPHMAERDWLVVSKGHAGPALYAALALSGFFPEDMLDTLNQPGTKLPSHCDRTKTPGVDISTGSLGQGISTAIGTALGNRLAGRSATTYLVVGDGECDEGQIWEGILFAAHHRVDNLIMFVDANKKQLDGTTDEVCRLGDLRAKLEAFDWFAQEIDGHDIGAIRSAIEAAKSTSGRPCAIVLNTVKGKGCRRAEQAEANHYMSFSPEQASEELQSMARRLEELKSQEPRS